MKAFERELELLKRKVILAYYRTNFTLVELAVIAGVIIWLTRIALFAIIYT